MSGNLPHCETPRLAHVTALTAASTGPRRSTPAPTMTNLALAAWTETHPERRLAAGAHNG